MLCSRLRQVRDGRFERVVRAEDVDIHDRLERIDGELVDRGKEVACCAGTGQVFQYPIIVLNSVRRTSRNQVLLAPSHSAPRQLAKRQTSARRPPQCQSLWRLVAPWRYPWPSARFSRHFAQRCTRRRRGGRERGPARCRWFRRRRYRRRPCCLSSQTSPSVINERKRSRVEEGNCTEKAVLPDVAEIVDLWNRHGGGTTSKYRVLRS